MDYSLPKQILSILKPFAQVFSAPTWKKAKFLCVGAILCQGARRISSILHIMGIANQSGFERYHRFLNRDEWNPLLAAKILLGLIIALVPKGFPLIIVLDETIERRKGKCIKAKGCYRDAVRSTQSHVVTCFGLKWLPLCAVIVHPWAKRGWAMPFLTFLQTSKEGDEKRGHHHRTTTDYVKIATKLLRKWIPDRSWILLGDGGFASLEMAQACLDAGNHLLSRLPIDGRLYDFPEEKSKRKRGRKPVKGKRIESFKTMLQNKESSWKKAEVSWYGGVRKEVEFLTGINLMHKTGQKPVPIRWVLVRDPEGLFPPVPLFSTDTNHRPEFIIETFVLRFSIEVMFEESRAHLGIETQRQWSDKAISRTTPLLFGLFSIVCLIALQLRETVAFSVRSSAWHTKTVDEATFSDIIAYVRRYLWAEKYLINSPQNADMIKFKLEDLDFLIERIAASP